MNKKAFILLDRPKLLKRHYHNYVFMDGHVKMHYVDPSFVQGGDDHANGDGGPWYGIIGGIGGIDSAYSVYYDPIPGD